MGRTAYILKVESKLKGSELIDKIRGIVEYNRLNEGELKKNQRGFINLSSGDSDVPSEQQKAILTSNYKGRIIFRYREYNEKRFPYTDEVFCIPQDIPILYDANKRIFVIFTSSYSEARKIENIFLKDDGPINFRPPMFRNDEGFFRWLIVTSKNHQEKLPHPCKLVSVEGVGIKDLIGSRSHPTTETIRLKSADHIADDIYYQDTGNEGSRFYIECNFLHSDWAFSLRIYSSGKVTLGKHPLNMDDNDFILLFSTVFEELENIYGSYKNDVEAY